MLVLIVLCFKQYIFNENLRKVKIYLFTSCNTEERIAQNIYIHNSNKNYKKKSTTRAILIKKRIGIGYKNYEKQCPGLELRLIPKLISWAGSKSKNLKTKNSTRLIRTNKLQQLKNLATKFYN